jgi:hypothetical protein
MQNAVERIQENVSMLFLERQRWPHTQTIVSTSTNMYTWKQ